MFKRKTDIEPEPRFFCCADNVPKDFLFYLDDTPCNELDPIDLSILGGGKVDAYGVNSTLG